VRPDYWRLPGGSPKHVEWSGTDVERSVSVVNGGREYPVSGAR